MFFETIILGFRHLAKVVCKIVLFTKSDLKKKDYRKEFVARCLENDAPVNEKENSSESGGRYALIALRSIEPL